MNAKQHIFLGMMVALSSIVLIVYVNPSLGQLYFEKNLLNIESFFVGLILYFVGLILPDSDSEDAGSKIFYTVFFPFAYLCKWIESPLAKKLGRRKGHRESLHTIFGIFITSLIVVILCSLILILDKAFVALTIPFLFFMLFMGQLVHLLGDWHWELV